MNKYESEEDAVKAGEKQENLFVAHGRTQKERDAVLLAAQFGNRAQRRARRFRPHLVIAVKDRLDGPADISAAERDRRAAARRVAKKQRKQNGGKA